MPVDAKAVPPLDRLPGFNQRNIHCHTAKHHSPLPRYRLVLKHRLVHRREVDNRKGNGESCHHRPEQEAVVVHRLEDRKGPLPPLIHIEEAAMEVLHFPGGDEK